MKNYQPANVDLQFVNPAPNYPKECGSLLQSENVHYSIFDF